MVPFPVCHASVLGTSSLYCAAFPAVEAEARSCSVPVDRWEVPTIGIVVNASAKPIAHIVGICVPPYPCSVRRVQKPYHLVFGALGNVA